MGIRFSDTNNLPTMGVTLTPAVGNPIPGGPMAFSSDGQIVKFQKYNIPNVRALADGIIRVEFYDFPDDAIGAVDGLWVSCTLRLQALFTIPAIPGPHVPGLFMLAGMASLSRRHPG